MSSETAVVFGGTHRSGWTYSEEEARSTLTLHGEHTFVFDLRDWRERQGSGDGETDELVVEVRGRWTFNRDARQLVLHPVEPWSKQRVAAGTTQILPTTKLANAVLSLAALERGVLPTPWRRAFSWDPTIGPLPTQMPETLEKLSGDVAALLAR